MEELRIQIAKDTERLAQLESMQGEKTNVAYNNGGEVTYHTITENNMNEIVLLRKKIMAEREQLKQMELNKHQNIENFQQFKTEQEIREKEKIKTAEELHKFTFQEVKKKYKNFSTFEKLKNKKPNFKKISKLSQEELEFLISLSKGQTIHQIDRNNRREEIYRNNGLSEKDISTKIREVNKQDFYRGLTDETYLHTGMELEENQIGRSR